MTYLFYIFIIASIVGLDQYSKNVIELVIEEGNNIKIIDNFFYLANVKNYGAAFSIMQNQRLILVAIPLIVVGVLAYIIIKNRKIHKLAIVSYLFIIGGAIGNLIDRAFIGYVRDFLDFYIFGYNYPTFNIADSFVCIGVFLLLIYYIFFEKKQNEKQE